MAESVKVGDAFVEVTARLTDNTADINARLASQLRDVTIQIRAELDQQSLTNVMTQIKQRTNADAVRIRTELDEGSLNATMAVIRARVASADPVRLRTELDESSLNATMAAIRARAATAEPIHLRTELDQSSMAVALVQANARTRTAENIKLKTDLDNATLSAAIVAANARSRTADNINLKTDLNVVASQGAIAQANAQSRTAENIDLKTDLNNPSLSAALASVSARIKEVDPIVLRSDVDNASLSASIAAVNIKIKQIDPMHLKSDIDDNSYATAMAGLKARLAAAHPKVEIETDIDKDKVQRSANNVTKVFSDGFHGIMSLLPGQLERAVSSPLIGTAFMGVLGAAVAIGGPLLAGGLVGALAAGIGLGGIAGALALQFKDPRITAGLDALKSTVIGRLKEASAQTVPAFQQAFQTIGQAFNSWTPQINNFFTGIKNIIPIITQGLVGFIGGFITPLTNFVKSSNFVDFIRLLAEGFTKTGQAIGDFFNRITANKNTMDGLKKGFEDLLNLIPSAIRLLADIVVALGNFWHWANAPAGNGVAPIQQLRNAWEQFRTAIQPMVSMMQGVISTLGHLAVALLPVAKGVLDVAIAVGNTLANAVRATLGPINSFIEVMRQHPAVLHAIGVAIGALLTTFIAWKAAIIAITLAQAAWTAAVTVYNAVAFAIKLATLGWTGAQIALNIAMAANPVGVVAALIVGLIAVIALAWAKFTGFREAVIATWTGIRAGVGFVVDWFVTSVWPRLQAVWDGITRGAVWLWQNAILPAWNGIRAAVGAVVEWFVNNVWPRIQSAWSGIATVVTWLWQHIFVPAWNGIRSVVEAAANFIRTTIMPGFDAAFRGVSTVVTWLWQHIFVPAWNGIRAVVEAAVNFIRSVILPGLGIEFRVIATVVTWLWQHVWHPAWEGIKAIIGVAWTVISFYFHNLAAVIRSVVAPVFLWLWHNIVHVAWEGIKIVIAGAWFVIHNIWDAMARVIRAVLGPVIEWFHQHWAATWEKIKHVVSVAWLIIQAIFFTIRAWIINNLIPIWESLKAKVEQAWEQIKQKVQQAWAVIGPIFMTIIGIIRDVLGPIFMWLWHNVIQPFGAGILAAILGPLIIIFGLFLQAAINIQNLATVFIWLWQNIVIPSWGGIAIMIQIAWAIIQPIWAIIKIEIGLIAAIVLWLWQNVWVPTWQGILMAVQIAWAIIQPIWAIMRIELELLGAVVMWLWQNVILPAWQGIQQAISIAGAVIGIVFEILKIQVGLLFAPFQFLWTNIIIPVWNGIQTAIQTAVEFIKAHWEGLKQALATLTAPFQFLWQNVIIPVWNGIQTVIQTAIQIITAIFNALMELLRGNFTQAWNYIWTGVIAPVWAGIQSIITSAGNVVNSVLSSISDFINGPLTQAWNYLWNGVVAPVWAGIQDIINAAWNIILAIFQALVQFIQGDITGAMDTLLHGVIEPVWQGIQAAIDGVWNFLRDNIFTPLTNLITNTVPEAFRNGVEAIRTAWEKIQDATKTPVNFVIGTVYNKGIVPVWNFVADKTGGGKLSELPTLATGGYVSGPGTSTSDSIHARLSDGEYVVNAAATKQHRGLIEAINDGKVAQASQKPEPSLHSTGGQVKASLPQFSSGGVFDMNKLPGFAGGMKKVWSGANGDNESLMNEHMNHVHVAMDVAPSGNTQFNEAIKAAADASGLPNNPVSGFRGGSTGSSGSADHHSEGRATDFGGFNQDALADYFAQLSGVIELIHRTSSADYGIFGGPRTDGGASGQPGAAGTVGNPNEDFGGKNDPGGEFTNPIEKTGTGKPAGFGAPLNMFGLDDAGMSGMLPGGGSGGPGKPGGSAPGMPGLPSSFPGKEILDKVKQWVKEYIEKVNKLKTDGAAWVKDAAIAPGLTGFKREMRGATANMIPDIIKKSLEDLKKKIHEMLDNLVKSLPGGGAISAVGGAIAGAASHLGIGKGVGGAAGAAGAAIQMGMSMITSFLSSLDSLKAEGGSATNIGSSGGGGVQQWAGLVAARLEKAGKPGTWLGPMLARMQQESGGNPNAINLTDSNAAAGMPSQGLMQTIGPTFNKFRDPSLPGGMTDPEANIAAAINYISATYGDPMHLPGGGYASGGFVSDPRNSKDRINAKLSDGEFVVNAGQAGKHLDLLNKINEGRIKPAPGLPGFANGGLVRGYADGGVVNASAAPGGAPADGAKGGDIKLNMTVEGAKTWKALWDSMQQTSTGTWDRTTKQLDETWTKMLDTDTAYTKTQWTKSMNDVTDISKTLFPNTTTFVDKDWRTMFDRTVLTNKTDWTKSMNDMLDISKSLFPITTKFVDDTWKSTMEQVKAGTVAQWTASWDQAKALGVIGMNSVITTMNDGIKAVNVVLTAVGLNFKIPEVTPVVAKAEGGFISGPGTSTSDSIPARLSDGEYVLRADAVKKIGVGNLNQMNEHGDISFVRGDESGMRVKRNTPGPSSTTNNVPSFSSSASYALGFAMGGDVAGKLLQTQQWLYQQAGKPYVMGAAGPDAYDCSGLVSAVLKHVEGQNPYGRLFSTVDEGNFFQPGFGGADDLNVGWYGGGGADGHTVGTIGGLNFEATPPHVLVGNTNMHPGDGAFVHKGHHVVGGGVPFSGSGGMAGAAPLFNAAQAMAKIIPAIDIEQAKFGKTGMGQLMVGAWDKIQEGLKTKADAQEAASRATSVGGLGPLTAEQGSVMQQAFAQAKLMGASAKVMLALFEAGFVENNWSNSAVMNDHDSIGFLQDRVSESDKYGTVAEILNVPHSTAVFVRQAMAKENAYSSAGRLAQAVQISAFPDRYDARKWDAVGALQGLGFFGPFEGFAGGGLVGRGGRGSTLYDTGGYLPPGATNVINNTGSHEQVLSPSASQALTKRIAGDGDGGRDVYVTVVLDGEIITEKAKAEVGRNNEAIVQAFRRGR